MRPVNATVAFAMAMKSQASLQVWGFSAQSGGRETINLVVLRFAGQLNWPALNNTPH